MYRRHRADPQAWFSSAEIARAAAYRRPLRRAALAEAPLALLGLAAVVAGHGAARLIRLLGIHSPLLQVIAVTSALVWAGALADAPLAAWRLAYERRWSFSRQTARGVLADRSKELALSLVLLNGAALGFRSAVRATPAWWLVCWVALSLLTVAMVMVAPAILSPLFNRFRPLEDNALVEATRELGRRAGVSIRQVLVMDASRRTAKHNAYFTGLGRTKRVVLWDTLLEDYQPAATQAVLAHELGHWRRHHVRTMLALSCAVTLPALYLVHALLDSVALQRWAGISGPADAAALPLGLGAAMVLQVLWLPVGAWLSRGRERQADLDAVELTGDAQTFTSMQHDLALKNLSDVAPSRLAYLLSSHPPAPERMALAVRR